MAEDQANYHVDMWDTPAPTYVCLLCAPLPRLRFADVEAVTTHLREVHDVDALPTETIPMLLAQRVAYDAL
jgi:hypothetical protein